MKDVSRRDARPEAAARDLDDHEVQVRLATVNVGIGLTILGSLGAQLYAFATWSQPHREEIVAIAAFAMLTAPLLHLLPLERIIAGRWREPFFLTWTTVDILFIAAITALDGGTRSPYSLLFVLPFLFGALSYPLALTALVGVIDMAAFLGVAMLVGGGFVYSGFGGFALLCIAVLSTWESRNQAARREHLARTARALRRSERISRLQARQQRAVASFGQLALSGAGIGELQNEAVRMLAEVLEADIVALLKLDPNRGDLEAVAGVGIPREMLRTRRIPGGRSSQAGYSLFTGTASVVSDWARETRFAQSPVLSELGAKSGVCVPIRAKGQPYGVVGIQSLERRDFSSEDVSFVEAISHVLANAIEQRGSEERTRHEALHDPLTGLANRNLFLDRLEHSLAQARRHGTSVAVLFLDLDQFKRVNDGLGHAAGDELLASVAPRLEQALRPGDTVARFGGDEFAVLVEDVETERDATRVAERIGEALARPFVLRRTEHFVSASIGISIGGALEAPESLIRDADAALYRAKERGRGGYEIFDEVMRSRVIDHLQTENDLRRALQRGELELHYQPIVSIQDRSVIALEALLRWRHPSRGLLGPAAFIPVAEESRLILPIGRWVIEEACRRAAVWQAMDPDGTPIGVSVNLSARQLADPDLQGAISESVESSGIDPGTLLLELTESNLLEDTEALERVLGSLRGLGVRLVLDDFGIGFSSLGYLKRLPLSAIKLDRSFVENLTESSVDAAIVRAVVEMASALGMRVVAEGVESEQQLRAVSVLGCGFAQGFHFSAPVPADRIPELLAGPVEVGGR